MDDKSGLMLKQSREKPILSLIELLLLSFDLPFFNYYRLPYYYPPFFWPNFL